ncbi:MAG: MFS transporter [Candidatus Heimdallarchaeota archaeon]
MPIYELFIGPKDANRNIRATFISATFGSLGFGMLMSNVLSIFILILANESTTTLGLVTMVGGLVSTIFIFPSGYIVDRWRRDIFIWIGAILFSLAVLILAFSTTIEMIIVAQLVIGVGWGISETAREALLADSLPSGTRSEIYARLFFLNMALSAVGPAVNIILFFILGDSWDLSILRIVIFASFILILISSVAILFMADKHALGKESESLAYRPFDDSKERSSFTIPIILVGSGLIIGFGAGMTVAFFPVFFRNEYNLRPILVNGIYFAMNLFTALSAIAGQRISRRIGLIETIFLLQMAAVYALAFITQYPPLILLIPLFIARNALMNASNPLSRTIVMDRIAKRHRGKWNALEQLAWGFFWNVSAAFGGWIIENYSFKVCFTITATLYMLATLPLLALFGRVEDEGKQLGSATLVEGDPSIGAEPKPGSISGESLLE